MFVEIGFGFFDVGKNLLKRNTTVSKRKTGDPYSTRIVPMAYIYLYIYIYVVKFLGDRCPPAAMQLLSSFKCSKKCMPQEMRLEVDPHGTCSIGSLGLRLWM